MITWKKVETNLLAILALIVLSLHAVTLSLKLLSEHKFEIKVQEPEFKIKVVRANKEQVKQIVETVEQKDEVKTVKKAFLGKKDQFFFKQTRAKEVGQFQEGAKSSVKQAEKKMDLSSLKVDPGKLAKKKERSSESKNSKISQSNDFLEDVPLGSTTKLNTQEFKFYGYYHRIKQKLEQHWGHSIQKVAEDLFRQGRRLPASVNHVTSLMVQLDQEGKIINIEVKGASGSMEFDQAAVESFNNAGPFPNPPEDMLVNGTVIIEWGFVVKS